MGLVHSMSFNLRVFTSKLKERLRNYSSLVCTSPLKGPQVIGQLTQKLFHGQSWAIVVEHDVYFKYILIDCILAE